ncbi:MAG: hypothetical protein V8S87_05470 [Oscillospiraceae bacterium]
MRKPHPKAQTAAQQAEALAGLFEALALPEQLSRRAGELAQLGDEKTAAEYRQLWDIVVSALEQCAAVLGDTAMDSGEFSRLFTLMLSKYDIGTIPVSLDRVSAGDFDRTRCRSIKHLIVLGVSDQRLPRTDDEAGVFSLRSGSACWNCSLSSARAVRASCGASSRLSIPASPCPPRALPCSARSPILRARSFAPPLSSTARRLSSA